MGRFVHSVLVALGKVLSALERLQLPIVFPRSALCSPPSCQPPAEPTLYMESPAQFPW